MENEEIENSNDLNEEVNVTIASEEIVETEEVEVETEEVVETEEIIETDDESETEEKYFTYTLNADNSVFLIETFISESDAKLAHDEDVSVLYAKQETLPESEYGAYKKIGTEIVADDEENIKQRQRSRYSLVANMFSKKNIAIKAMAIGKPEISRDLFSEEQEYVSYINEQFTSYREQYQNAKNGLYSESENKEIVAKYEQISSLIAPINKLSNEVRSLLMKLILENSEDFQIVFDKVDTFSINMDEVISGAYISKIEAFRVEIGVDDGTN